MDYCTEKISPGEEIKTIDMKNMGAMRHVSEEVLWHFFLLSPLSSLWGTVVCAGGEKENGNAITGCIKSRRSA